MPLLIAAAASDGGGSLGWIVALAAAGVLVYLAACVMWPFGACRRCRGTGKFRSPTGRAWRHCPRCKGTGRRVRGGRRAWTSLTRTRDAGRR